MSERFKLITDPVLLVGLDLAVKKHFPRSTQIWNIIQMLGYRMYPEEVSVTLFQYVEEVQSEKKTSREDDPFLVAFIQPDLLGKYVVVVWNPSPLNDIETDALDSLIDWNAVDAFSNVHSHIAPTIRKLLDLHAHQRKISYHVHGQVLTMPRRNVEKEIEDDKIFTLKDLPEDQVLAMVDNWRYAAPTAKEVAKWCIGNLPSAVGLFSKEDELMISGALFGPPGSIYSLFTLDQYQRRGCAGRVMKRLCANIMEAGLIPMVDVDDGNQASVDLMQKLGFTFGYEEDWYFLKENDNSNGDAE